VSSWLITAATSAVALMIGVAVLFFVSRMLAHAAAGALMAIGDGGLDRATGLRPSLTPDEALTTFLRINHPERYCAACLGLQFKLSLEETYEALGPLLDRGAAIVDTRVCHSCGRTREVFTGRIRVRRKAP
jgi:hypothetical protein